MLCPLIAGLPVESGAQDHQFPVAGIEIVEFGQDIAAPGHEPLVGFGNPPQCAEDVEHHPPKLSTQQFADVIGDRILCQGFDSRFCQSHRKASIVAVVLTSRVGRGRSGPRYHSRLSISLAMAAGLVWEPYRLNTLPSPSIKNLVKFHLIRSVPSTPLASDFSQLYRG